MTIRVVVADDAKGVRDLVSLVLTLEDEFEVVGEATDGRQAIDVVRQCQPDLVVLDVDMPGRDGLSVIPDVRAVAPHSKLVLFTGHDEPEVLAEAAGSGDAVVRKDGDIDELVRSIKLLIFGR